MERKEIPVQTLAEMARETQQLEAASQKGIACPVCGCRDLRVQTTRRGEGLILRYRVCRSCGAHKPTIES